MSKNPGGGSGDSEEGSGQDESGGGSPVGGDSEDGSGQSNPGGGSQEGQQTGGKTGTAHTPVTASKSADGGSSSPLVPILIALAVLAAISVGVVLVRQRRQGDDPGGSVSPTKAS
jgi:cobalamin biosynthesis Mg chelatase CobN